MIIWISHYLDHDEKETTKSIKYKIFKIKVVMMEVFQSTTGDRWDPVLALSTGFLPAKCHLHTSFYIYGHTCIVLLRGNRSFIIL